MSQNKRVLMLLSTNSVKNDERVIKEAHTLAMIGISVQIHACENSNAQARYAIENIPIHLYKCTLKKILGRLHVVELFIRVLLNSKIDRRTSPAVWVHDPIMFSIIPFLLLLKKLGLIDSIIWDHHELPPKAILKSRTFRKLFSFCARCVDKNVQANRWRATLFRRLFLKKAHTKLNVEVIRNFPSQRLFTAKQPDNNIMTEAPFIYIQSGFGEHRNFSYLRQALKKAATLPIVFSGEVPEDTVFEDFSVPVTTLGKIPPEQLIWYFQHAAFTVILYNKDFGLNNYYCEPNRLFHAIKHDLPAIVGSNPPMAKEVSKLKCGLILSDDGTDVQALQESIYVMCHSYGKFKRNREIEMNWEQQTPVFKNILAVH